MFDQAMKELSWRGRVLFVAYQLNFFLFIAGIYVAAFGQRIGAYMLLAGLAGYQGFHRIFPIIASRDAKIRLWPELRQIGDRELELGYLVALAALLSGVFAAMLEARFGAYLLLVGFGGQLALDLLIGAAAYRETMRRPWPDVAPLDDDDDW
jgi:hypothetical protein